MTKIKVFGGSPDPPLGIRVLGLGMAGRHWEYSLTISFLGCFGLVATFLFSVAAIAIGPIYGLVALFI